MVFKMEVDAYVKFNSIKVNVQKAYSMVLVQCTKLLKSKTNKIKGWNQSPIKYYFLYLVDLIKSIIFKFKDQKYPDISFHK